MRSFWIDAGRRGGRAMPLKIVDVVGNQAFERELQNGWGIDLSEFKQIVNDAIARHMADADDYDAPDDSEIAENKTPGSDYEWSCVTEQDEDDDDDGIDEDTITPARQDISARQNTPARQPKSIFEDEACLMKLFGSPQKKDEDAAATKNPFVFIANRLTFLAQTVQPIIFDTSCIVTGEDFITIAVNEDKTFPKIKNFDDLGRIACQINCNQTIRDEIAEFLKGSEYSDIFCFPEFLSKNGPGTDVWALKFICYKDK